MTGGPYPAVPPPALHVRVRRRCASHRAATSFDAVLTAAGITRHDLPLHKGKEKGVDVQLALEAWDRATTTPLPWGRSPFRHSRCQLSGKPCLPRSERCTAGSWKKVGFQQFLGQTLWSSASRHAIIMNETTVRSRHGWPGSRASC